MKNFKLSELPKKKVDVLIIDEQGSNWIKYCIPKSCLYSIVKTRGVVSYINSYSFIIRLFLNIVRLGLKNKLKLSTALYLSIIDELKPKVVVTFIDNNYLLGRLSIIRTKIKFISVQNGIRVNRQECIGAPSDGHIFGSYYAFGEFEKFVYSGALFKDYYAVGSLKLGVFLSKYDVNNLMQEKNKTVCFVSQYRKHMENSANELHIQYLNTMMLMYKTTVLWARYSGYKIVVAMVNSKADSEYESELGIFRSIAEYDNVLFCANKGRENNLSSYKLAIESDIAVGMDSALMIEVFGIKQKVLWGVSSQQDLLSKLGLKMYKEKLPSELMLQSLDQSEFNSRIDKLLEIPQEKYVSLTESARKYFMNIDAPYPHKVIYKDIERCVKEGY